MNITYMDKPTRDNKIPLYTVRWDVTRKDGKVCRACSIGFTKIDKAKEVYNRHLDGNPELQVIHVAGFAF